MGGERDGDEQRAAVGDRSAVAARMLRRFEGEAE
ncbi:hypothetical protein VT85_13700 [Planctomyces sp. SH-PL62]|nr:hypothetical protein VT85_13700 [Planctomyces sp. SH-PL62]